MPKTVATKPYDWTYTTTYTGSDTASSSHASSWKPADPENESHTIPLAELTRPDPILFYAEVPLYEDELGDNGSSHVLVRIVSPVSSRGDYGGMANSASACDAGLYLHSVEVHAASGQRPLPDV